MLYVKFVNISIKYFFIFASTEQLFRAVLKNYVNFTGKKLFWSLFFETVTGCGFATFKRFQHRVFSVNFALRNLF